ncbi:homoserine dehydrogenase [Luminiphilus sp.]|nr:homoserine dehydrogenase [Luminiphilus sp.]MDB2557705.1 homoserine dehydrogenase [Luminiphilus sp.]MDB2667368.1 homoserine dehydrogenase [Luminiphilus sp.]MDB3933491.1 homoserine dehydrogenase [Luminiphilus sp.]
MTQKTINVGICGLGTVAQGLLALLAEANEVLEARVGGAIKVVHVATRTAKPNVDVLGAYESRDVFDVARNPDVDILVELIGGTTVARELVREALNQGKHVVTANKALLADYGDELFELAQAQGKALYFEAAVAGGIPIIEAVRASLAANHITGLAGIINGTGNFILTEMAAKGREFADVLEEAQRLGYAEADPSFDVDGTDAAQKLVLLAALAFGAQIDAQAPFKQGVDSVSPLDLEYALELGYRIKHLGIAKRDGESLQLRVHPTLIPKTKALAQVDGVLNAVMINASGVGELLLVGPGAGSRPTASAVSADIVAIARAMASNGQPQINALGVPVENLMDMTLSNIADVSSAWYLRLEAEDKPGVMASITQRLSEHGIGIESLIQKPESAKLSRVPVIILTDEASTQSVVEAVAAIEALATVEGPVTSLRVENF